MTSEQISSVSDAIAERVIAARKAQSLTRDELAAASRAAGLPDTFSGVALRNLETGRRDATGRRVREVSVDELVALAAALGCSPLDLVGGPAAALFGLEQAACRVCEEGQGRLEATVRADVAALEELGGVEASLAQAAYVLAAIIDGKPEVAKLPALTRELRNMLDAIMAGRRGVEAPDPDEDDDLDDLDEPE